MNNLVHSNKLFIETDLPKSSCLDDIDPAQRFRLLVQLWFFIKFIRYLCRLKTRRTGLLPLERVRDISLVDECEPVIPRESRTQTLYPSEALKNLLIEAVDSACLLDDVVLEVGQDRTLADVVEDLKGTSLGEIVRDQGGIVVPAGVLDQTVTERSPRHDSVGVCRHGTTANLDRALFEDREDVECGILQVVPVEVACSAPEITRPRRNERGRGIPRTETEVVRSPFFAGPRNYYVLEHRPENDGARDEIDRPAPHIDVDMRRTPIAQPKRSTDLFEGCIQGMDEVGHLLWSTGRAKDILPGLASEGPVEDGGPVATADGALVGTGAGEATALDLQFETDHSRQRILRHRDIHLNAGDSLGSDGEGFLKKGTHKISLDLPDAVQDE